MKNLEDKCTEGFGPDYMKKYERERKSMCQFVPDGDEYWPSKKTIDELPSAMYRIKRDYQRGIFFKKTNVISKKLVHIESSPLYSKIMNDIETFWKSRKEYTKRGRIYKRNILLYSTPGMGKSSLITMLTDDLINNRNGIVVYLSEESDILNFSEAAGFIRGAMPDKPLIFIIEDIDKFIGGNKDCESELLAILDGIDSLDNTVIVATTNYPEELTDRFINRPSRFNLILEYPKFNEENRKEFLIKINLKEDIDSIDLDKWVKRSDGYTPDMLKELSDSVFINKENEDDAFKFIDTIKNRKVVKCNNDDKKIGFNPSIYYDEEVER